MPAKERRRLDEHLADVSFEELRELAQQLGLSVPKRISRTNLLLRQAVNCYESLRCKYFTNSKRRQGVDRGWQSGPSADNCENLSPHTPSGAFP